ncbi:OmpA family protein [Botryobacter ruber]|uniref:OmpA family protein n=1 Tax=Botryobacter ruber TaxID=2171629 RepID=UPI000E0BD8D0|nr:OmpA family protein [Botryobacter ruber]
MFKVLLLLLLLLTGFVNSTLAQTASLSTSSKRAEELYYKADTYVKARDFRKALEVLSDATEKDPDFGEAYLKSANLYKMMGEKEAAFQHLQKGLALVPFNPARANEYYTLAGFYFDRGNYQAAKEQYEHFLRANPRNQKLADLARKHIRTTDFALRAMENPVNFNPELLPAPLNQFGLQYFPYTTADQHQIIFTARLSSNPGHDENIYVSQWHEEGGWQEPVSISGLINSAAQEGAATISGDGKTLVFTSCNRPDSYGDCDLYISRRTGNEWSKPRNMGNTVNSRAWDSQPSLSADGRTLYFTSTRGGGQGQEDIWVTFLQDDGNWLKPVNLGASVNTNGKDMAPFIHASGSTLYFVSDGHLGMGGLDAFKTTFTKQRSWTEPVNMGYPLNTHADEGSVIISPDNRTGYYSRQTMAEAGNVGIHIFKFEVPDSWKSSARSTYAQGRVFDSETKKPLAGVVQLYDVKADSLVQQVTSDPVSGEYTVVLTEGKQYALYVSAPKYLMNSLSFDYTSSQDLAPLVLDVYLNPIKAGAAVVLNNLFFATGEYKLVEESKTELNKIIGFMRQNDGVKVEIAGHTDDVGSDAANQVLSEKRAKAVVDYLTTNGIPKVRIQYKGYGEAKPVKPNTSEENRSQNRRIEMQVL